MVNSAKFFNSSGQATVEYLIILIFIVTISYSFVDGFSGLIRDSLGDMGHVLSMNLSSGVCPERCFFGSFSNGGQ